MTSPPGWQTLDAKQEQEVTRVVKRWCVGVPQLEPGALHGGLITRVVEALAPLGITHSEWFANRSWLVGLVGAGDFHRLSTSDVKACAIVAQRSGKSVRLHPALVPMLGSGVCIGETRTFVHGASGDLSSHVESLLAHQAALVSRYGHALKQPLDDTTARALIQHVFETRSLPAHLLPRASEAYFAPVLTQPLAELRSMAGLLWALAGVAHGLRPVPKFFAAQRLSRLLPRLQLPLFPQQPVDCLDHQE